MSEQNKAVVMRMYNEVINAGNTGVLDEIVTPDFIEHEKPPGVTDDGLEAGKQLLGMFHSAFPDLRFTVEDIFAEGDRVAARVSITGTHQGELMGIPPTGKQVTMDGIDIFRFAGGKIAEHWGRSDDLGLMQQLGAIPSE